INNEAPLPFQPGPKVIVHCIPLQSLAGKTSFDVLKLASDLFSIPLLYAEINATRVNLDGLLGYAGADTSHSYTQLFRNGKSVSARLLRVRDPAQKTIPFVALEQEVLLYAKKCLVFFPRLGIEPPVAIAVTLTDVDGFRMARDPFSFQPGQAIREKNILLPEIVIEDFNVPITKAL